MTLDQMSDAELWALMNETHRLLDLAEGAAMIMHTPQLRAQMRKHAATHRANFNALMAEYDSRRPPQPEMTTDELRDELAEFA